MDYLLIQLKELGIGCHWNHHFAGVVCYADDLTLLAPSPSALRLMLQKCEQFAESHGLKFNASKTQLVRFGRTPVLGCSHKFIFCGSVLPVVASAVHLGHILRADLDDSDDILRVARDIARKANCMLVTFAGVDPFVKTKLFQSFCLPLYGSVTWNLSCRGFKTVEIMLNNCLRKIWRLPTNSHTGILHCTAGLMSVANNVFHRSQMLLRSVILISLLHHLLSALSFLILLPFVSPFLVSIACTALDTSRNILQRIMYVLM